MVKLNTSARHRTLSYANDYYLHSKLSANSIQLVIAPSFKVLDTERLQDIDLHNNIIFHCNCEIVSVSCLCTSYIHCTFVSCGVKLNDEAYLFLQTATLSHYTIAHPNTKKGYQCG